MVSTQIHPSEGGTLMRSLLYEDLTQKVIGTCFEVSRELGIGFVEGVYESAMVVALAQKGIQIEAQVPLKVKFRGVIVGEFFVDILVENKLIVELKAVSALRPEHQAQVINYLKATGIEVGLLVNFGNARVEYRRLYRNKDSNRIDRINGMNRIEKELE